MRRTMILAVAAALILTPLALAQDEAPPMMAVTVVDVQLGHVPRFEAARKELWKGHEKVGVDWPVNVSQSMHDPGSYGIVTMIDSLGQMDERRPKMEAGWQAASGAMGTLMEAATTWESWVMRSHPELSYTPEDPRLSEDEAPYWHMTTLHVDPAQMDAFEAVVKEWGAMAAKHGMRDGYSVWTSVMGDGPAYSVLMWAKDPADYWTQTMANEKKFGEDRLALMAKMGPMIRDIEYAYGMSRPDLSYQP